MTSINIQDIMQSSDGKISIEGHEAKLITFVGTVEKIEAKVNFISYTVRDDTGEIEVLLWVDIGASSDVLHTTVSKGMFCRVVGSVIIKDGNSLVLAINISKLRNANEITTHLLETRWIRLKLRQLKEKKSASSSSSQLPNSNITLTPQQQLIYTIVKAETAEIGIEKTVIVECVQGKLQQKEVENILDYLCSKGFMFSTVDVDHFKVSHQ